MSRAAVARQAGRQRTSALRHTDIGVFLIVGDALVVAGGSLWAPDLWSLLDNTYQPTAGVVFWQLSSTVLWLLALRVVGAYDPVMRRSARRLLGAIGQSVAIVAVIALTGFYFYPFFAPRSSTLMSVGLVGVCLMLWRAGYLGLVSRHLFNRRVAIVGVDEGARRAADALIDLGGSLYTVVAFLAPGQVAQSVRDVPVINLADDVWNAVRVLDIDQLIVGESKSLPPAVLSSLIECFEHGIETVPATSVYEDLSGRVLVAALEADWYGEVPTHVRGLYAATKRVVDLCGAFLLGIVATPVFIVVALSVWIDSGRPVLLRQVRVGQRGQPFLMHKFRTMRKDAEAGGPVWATRSDTRVTRVGRFLRRSRLDELPQLWDVLRGAMSLIGPRPERPEFAAKLARELPLYRARTLVRPGITGWAQVQYPYADSVESNLAKLEYDLYYEKHFGPVLDAAIALRTVGVVLGLGGH